ncbi:MAG: hypothetical protein JSS14_28890 [Proteobacteria bacterium]|nr:hypothetical protein [Pseudomonadota bacterium]
MKSESEYFVPNQTANQELLWARVANVERLASATLKEVKLHGISLNERLGKMDGLIHKGSDLSEERFGKMDGLIHQVNDLSELLNSLAKFHHRLDEIESHFSAVKRNLNDQVADVRRELATISMSSDEKYRNALSSIEARINPVEARIPPLEARIPPLEARIAILSSTTLFLKAVGRRLKMRISQLQHRK